MLYSTTFKMLASFLFYFYPSSSTSLSIRVYSGSATEISNLSCTDTSLPFYVVVTPKDNTGFAGSLVLALFLLAFWVLASSFTFFFSF